MSRKRKDRLVERAYMPLYTGRYLRKTRRLRDRHHGAYLLILMALWEEGGSLPDDSEELRQIACSDKRTWAATWAKIRPYFSIHEGRVSQPMLTELLQDFDELRRSRVAGGKRSGAIHAEKQKKNKDRVRAEPGLSLSSKAKGFASPSEEGERQSLPDRYRDEFSRILTAPYLRRSCKPESLQAVQDSLVAFDGETFFVGEACEDASDWQRICEQVGNWRYRLALSDQRVLKFDDFKRHKGG